RTGSLSALGRENASTNMSWVQACRACSSARSRRHHPRSLTVKLSNYRGKHLQLDHARLFDRPTTKPTVVIAASGSKAVRFAGEKGDGLMATEARSDLVQEFHKGGGFGPRYAEVALCCSGREEDARDTAHKYFRWSITGWPVLAELPDTNGFAAASKYVSADSVAPRITCGPSAG